MAKNSSTHESARALFMERFPQLALLVPTWEPKETIEEALPFLDPGKAEVFYFYGLGAGEAYFPLKKWLKGDPERELIFLEEEPGIISSFLDRARAVEILSNPQVSVTLLSKKTLELQLDALAELFPTKRVDVGALPSYQGRRFQNLRLKLLRKTTLSHALHMDRLHGYQPFENFIQNIKHLPSSFYANALKDSFKNIPAIVCGAGPSLQHSMKILRTLENKALIIAGGSTLAALSSQGVLPHFGMAIDPNLEEYRRLKNSFAFEVPLLYSTRVFPSIFQTCNGPFGYMRSGIGGVPELWIEEELGLLDPLLGEFLSSESISVTAICVAWAQFLGCNPILLNGVDLAYTGKKRYASGVGEDEEILFRAIDAEKSAADRILKRKDRKGNVVYTAVRWVMESASLSYFAKKHQEVRFINTTDGGIGFRGIDFQPLSQARDQYLTQEFDLRGMVHQQIALAAMPADAPHVISQKIDEMKLSLERSIGFLRILSREEKGSIVLAEMELKEEMAYLYLFYDIHQVLDQSLLRTFRSWVPAESVAQKEDRLA
ncbi:MAG: 6-hydroxymethylpterin diphosphokinase MptE-like protein, partial [Chlamydiota bacterium]